MYSMYSVVQIQTTRCTVLRHTKCKLIHQINYRYYKKQSYSVVMIVNQKVHELRGTGTNSKRGNDLKLNQSAISLRRIHTFQLSPSSVDQFKSPQTYGTYN